jgi:DCN1-like protein 1/2
VPFRDVNAAVDEYYNKGYGQEASTSSKKSAVANPKKVEALFVNYMDQSSKRMEADGIERFFNDLGVDPMDLVTLQLSKYMQAETMGVYT